RAVIGVIALAAAVLISVLVMWAQTPDWAPLFTNLAPRDAGEIVAKLKEQKVAFQIGEGGGAILVPSKHVHELRLQLAGQGLPQGGTVGFELFDKNNFGMTDFNQKLNYQRALQGELTRTISEMSGIEQARVHLVIPQDNLFADPDKEKEPTAAVVLKLHAGVSLEPGQVKAISHLVARSVEGLKDSAINISDVNGRNYSDEFGLSGNGSELSMRQLDIKRSYEKEIKKNLQALLDRVLGPNGAAVNVSAEVNLDQIETNRESYSPVGGAEGTQSGIVRSQKEIAETYSGNGNTASGVPGVQSNVTGVPSYPAGANGSNGSYKKTDTTKNYEINKEVERKIKQPIEVKRLSVAIAVNGNPPPEQLTELKNMLSAAAGIDGNRGDTLVISALKWNDKAVKEQSAAMDSQASSANMNNLLKTGGMILLGIIALLILRRALSGIGTPRFDMGNAITYQEDLSSVAELDGIGHSDRKSQLTKEISKVVKKQPDDAARLIKTWLIEDQ
ncbi:MAG TPA: flagellar basal-body MS-ring/collar protein FliF, partial [Chroococcales cyanobacterium]